MMRVVLLGGGYVTVHAYRSLVRRLGREVREGRVEIVVVSADDAHSFHGFTGEVLAGLLPYERTRTPLQEACPLARFVHARVLAVDPAARSVTYEHVADGVVELLWFDHLVVGTGAQEPVDGVPGLREHGYTLRAPGDIAALTQALHALARTARDDRSAGSTVDPAAASVVVAGGGLAGAEMAAAVADLGGGTLAVTLVHSGERIVPELRADQPALAARTESELARLGVVVRTGTRLTAVTPDGAHLDDGTFLPAAVVLGTVGQAPVPLPGLGSTRDERGRLVTAPDLSVTGDVWAGGDAARVVRPGTDAPVPANALWAIKTGAHVGDNVARAIAGRTTRPFTYRGLGRAASFGLGRSVAELYGVGFTGAVAWVLRLVFFLRFMPSRRRALAVLGDLTSRRGTSASREADPLRAKVEVSLS